MWARIAKENSLTVYVRDTAMKVEELGIRESSYFVLPTHSYCANAVITPRFTCAELIAELRRHRIVSRSTRCHIVIYAEGQTTLVAPSANLSEVGIQSRSRTSLVDDAAFPSNRRLAVNPTYTQHGHFSQMASRPVSSHAEHSAII